MIFEWKEGNKGKNVKMKRKEMEEMKNIKEECIKMESGVY